MCSKNFIVFVISILIASSFAQPETSAPARSTRPPSPPTPPTPPTVTPPITECPTRPTIAPSRPCPPQNNCTRKNLSICGRNREGMCHRFENMCELQLTNCAAVNVTHAWRRVPMMQCRNLRQNAIARCNIYVPRCLRPLPKCPRPTGRRGICVISRNRRFCRIVANRCTLRNLNCQAQPGERWTAINMVNCRDMRVGASPMACRRPLSGK